MTSQTKRLIMYLSLMEFNDLYKYAQLAKLETKYLRVHIVLIFLEQYEDSEHILWKQ